MCGGFVIAYSSAKIEPTASRSRQFVSHLFYNIGRISAYVTLGIFVGFLGSLFGFSNKLNGYFYFVVGLLMVLMGLSLMGKIKFLTSIESNIAFNPTVKRIFSYLINTKKIGSFFGLGFLNGLLPCGLVYFFLAKAASSGSFVLGGLTMLIFGVATIPTLLGLGFVVGFFKGGKKRAIMIQIASFIIIAYGVYMAYLGYMGAIA